jgi:uncharacterized protein (DUF952 family)
VGLLLCSGAQIEVIQVSRFKLSDHCPYQEFFHPDYIDYFKGIGWNESRIFDHIKHWVNPVFIDTYESLRKRYGALYLNNWHSGGSFKNAGKRIHPFVHNGKTYGESVGAPMSSHYESNSTGDFHFVDKTPQEVQWDILNNPDRFPHIYRMESTKVTTGWLHVEAGERMPGGIIIFSPKQ